MGSVPPELVPQIGADGIPMDAPIVAYTEKVLEEKELQIRKYIQDNYAKIQNVERELASLTMELKLTAGPKKAALEHLRKKIEASAEKIESAKQKEEHARKVWESANNLLKEEEENKKQLCEDLHRLVQESAAFQYQRLEGMKHKLEALNSDVGNGANQSSHSLSEGLTLTISQQGAGANTLYLQDHNGATKQASNSNNNKVAILRENGNVEAHGRPQVPPGQRETTSKSVHIASAGKGRGQGRGQFVLQRPKGDAWTGAGFDVDANSSIR